MPINFDIFKEGFNGDMFILYKLLKFDLGIILMIGGLKMSPKVLLKVLPCHPR